MAHLLRCPCYLVCNSVCLTTCISLSFTHTEWTFLFYLFFLDLTLERSIPTEQWRLKSTEVRERFFRIIWSVACLQTIQSPSEVFSGSQCHTLSQTSQFFFFFPEANWYLLWYLAYRKTSKKSELLLFLSSLWHLSFLCFPFTLFSLGFYRPGVFQSDLQDADFGLAQWGGSAPGPQTRTSLYRLGFCPHHRSHEIDEQLSR